MSKIAKDEPFYQISQVSKILGITSDRIRTYEEEGLIKPFRFNDSETGKRLYTQEEVEYLEIIRELIKLGVTIPVIRVVLSLKFTVKKSLKREKDKQIVELLQKLYSFPLSENV